MAWQQLSLVVSDPLRDLCDHVWVRLPLGSTLSTFRRTPKRKSSGLKLFGISKCTARTQKSPPRKCPAMCALQKYAGLISFGISVYKKPGGGGTPSRGQRRKNRT